MMEPYTPSLESDYKICESTIKEHSKSFYYAFSSLPELDAKAVYAIYAFCRMADDAIDHAEDAPERMENLRELESDLDGFIAGEPPNTPMWRALWDTCERYDIDASMLYAQIKGQEMDVNFEQPEDMKDLIHYSNHVAGSVGRLLLPILCDNPSAERKINAEKLGVAMQITNILRDVGEDMREHGRVYIPAAILRQHGCAMNQIEEGEIDQVFINAWEDLATHAEVFYDDFRSEIIHYKEEAQLPLLLSLSVYREILNEVRRNGYDCFTKRNAVSMARKMKIRNEESRFLKKIKDA
ncbi:squalene/phytoene synthase family protein [Salinicoccus sp. ID82-1]|uniref:phytoene/squalene synthase family protein n=1 Tax=Salinicoccus sp. ID82-1 TaxID=2820269 RepID=UPI001F3F602A|nr:phytoene/squalene synthase family protein [Salinicoccus sp. ID82-1]MCG1010512.1 squalene/phytoene synthase family protein [Salinicoccus sp. ID82-1]